MRFACDWPGRVGVPRPRERQTPKTRVTSCISTNRRSLRPASGNKLAEGDQWGACGSSSSLDVSGRAGYLVSQAIRCFQLLQPSIGPCNIPCTNSVLLSRHDRVLLGYFPSSNVYYLHAGREWSPLKYVYEVTASSSAMVMHMMMALSASEMRRAGIGGIDASSCMALELSHYTAALRGIRGCLVASRTQQDASIDATIAILFFMVNYGGSSTSSLAHARVHLNGLNSFFQSYIAASNQGRVMGREGPTLVLLRERGLPPLSSHLVLWLLYLDIEGAFNGTFSSLINMFTEFGQRNFCLKMLYRDARYGFTKMWGEKYPADHRVDDVEAVRPLELAHRLQLVRSRVYQSRTDLPLSGGTQKYAHLMADLRRLRQNWLTRNAVLQEYDDVFSSVKEGHGSQYTSPSVKQMVAKLLAHYWACVLFCRRWHCPSRPAEDIHTRAAQCIVDIVRDQHAQEKRRMLRYVWPMFMATIETKQPTHQEWMLDRLREMHHASAECEWSWNTAKKLTDLRATLGVPEPDLTKFAPFIEGR
ncbi:hypothetical protein JX266_013669 [Neoarthrinium moseri]|nr:hypothetical protein JX266_013669 [Neoarthrinium moseri]